MSNETLFAQYQIAVERCRNLKSTLAQKEKQWAEIERQHKKTISLIKSLCITILQNDREENQKMLGENYKLGKTNDVISKASKLYQKYITEQTGLIADIVNENKQQQEVIEGLKTQIEGLLAQKGETSSSATNNDNNPTSDESKHIPKGMRDGAKAGKVHVHVEEDDNIDSAGSDDDAANAIAQETAAQAPMTQSVPTTIPKQTAQKARERKKNAIASHMVNLNDYDISEEGWETLRCVGEDGISRSSELIIALTKKFAITENKARNAIKALVIMKALQTESIASPLHSKFSIYYLDEIGKRLFKEKFNKKPVLSEAEKIAKKHANCIHGYGIFFAAEQIRTDDYFTKVTDNCPTIKIREGVEYVPDIMGTDRNGKVWYFEYELGHHMQKDFNAKCMKMEHETDILNFIVPNVSAEKVLLAQLTKWIESKGRGYFKGRDLKIRLTGALRIKGCDVRKDDCWHYIFEPRKEYTKPRQSV